MENKEFQMQNAIYSINFKADETDKVAYILNNHIIYEDYIYKCSEIGDFVGTIYRQRTIMKLQK